MGTWPLVYMRPSTDLNQINYVNSLTFPVTARPVSDPNTLDDYEEGTWVPTGNVITYAAAGTYVKIGKMVTAVFSITFPITTDAGSARVDNLPFIPTNTENAGVCFSSNTTGLALLGRVGSSGGARIYLSDLQNSGVTITNAQCSGDVIHGTVTYFAA